MAGLYVLSAQPSLPEMSRGSDKVAHAAAYAALGLLTLRATHGGLARLRPAATASALVITAAYGLFDELHQAGVAGREAAFADWLADVAGAGLAALGAIGAGTLRARRRRPAAEGQATGDRHGTTKARHPAR
jgi:VanZ family protein